MSNVLCDMSTPEDLHYTAEHEWIRPLGESSYRIGITDYAQDQLGDIVYVELPDLGDQVEAGAVVAEVESTKSVGEVYAPMSGTVSAVNEDVVDTPELVNQDPYGDGWLIELAGAELPAEVLTAEAYQALVD